MINRELQYEILQKMKNNYVNAEQSYTLKDINSSQNKDEILFNLKYLVGHGLLKNYTFGSFPPIGWINDPAPKDTRQERDTPIGGEITAKGIDFLENDGGLSAILDTLTVKLHADTIRDLIDAKIVESKSIPEQEKPALREALKGMKEEGLKQLTTRLISYGLDQGAITAQQLSQWIPS